MKNTRNQIIAFLLALIIQACFAGLIFLGGLLDPLLSLWALGIYFFIVSSYLMYRSLLTNLFKENENGCTIRTFFT